MAFYLTLCQTRKKLLGLLANYLVSVVSWLLRSARQAAHSSVLLPV